MKFQVKEKVRKFVNFEETPEVSVLVKGFVDTQYSRALWGVDTENGEELLIPLTSTLKDLEQEIIEKGDVVAFKYEGEKKSKNGRKYKHVSYTVYKKGKDFDLDELLKEIGTDEPPF